jgi:uncharacterized membrane protein
MNNFPDEWQRHRGKVIGLVLGLIIGLTIIAIGLFKALFVILCATLGYYIGMASDMGKNFTEILDRILPPGSR